ncbi:MAG: hypothetical protein AAGA20_00060 [Planctomycetota bacterium]
MPSPPRSVPRLPLRGLLLALLPVLVACGGRDVRVDRPVEPRLAAERLGGVTGALTYDGDWVGGMPPAADLRESLELARRRGVEIVVDLAAGDGEDLRYVADDLGLGLVEIDRNEVSLEAQELTSRISNAAVDSTLRVLAEPGRSRALVLDDDGSLATSIYIVHLASSRGIPRSAAIDIARAAGLSDFDLEFVERQIERVGVSASSGTR